MPTVLIVLLVLVLLLSAGSFLERRNQKTEAQNPGFLITKHTTIGDLLTYDPEVASVLAEQGMHCVGCPASRAESLEQAALVHGLDPDELLSAVRQYFAAHPVSQTLYH